MCAVDAHLGLPLADGRWPANLAHALGSGARKGRRGRGARARGRAAAAGRRSVPPVIRSGDLRLATADRSCALLLNG